MDDRTSASSVRDTVLKPLEDTGLSGFHWRTWLTAGMGFFTERLRSLYYWGGHFIVNPFVAFNHAGLDVVKQYGSFCSGLRCPDFRTAHGSPGEENRLWD